MPTLEKKIPEIGDPVYEFAAGPAPEPGEYPEGYFPGSPIGYVDHVASNKDGKWQVTLRPGAEVGPAVENERAEVVVKENRFEGADVLWCELVS